MSDLLALRADLAIISDWISPGSRVLDLGCGDGKLLAYLQQARNVRGYGLEIDPDNVTRCIEADVNVIQSDLESGLSQFEDGSFDYVIMTQALQETARPDQVLQEMLRIGRQGVVTFPNFGYWRCRFGLASGSMPKTNALPEQWYDTRNIHLCTIADFEHLCAQSGFKIVQSAEVNSRHQRTSLTRFNPNLFAQLALYQLETI